MAIDKINRQTGPNYRLTINGDGPTTQTPGNGGPDSPNVDNYTVTASIVVGDLYEWPHPRHLHRGGSLPDH